MANTESDGKEKGAEVLGENALDGIAGGGGEGMEAGLNLGKDISIADIEERVKQVKQFEESRKKFIEDFKNP
jgi:hypothetical protein